MTFHGMTKARTNKESRGALSMDKSGDGKHTIANSLQRTTRVDCVVGGAKLRRCYASSVRKTISETLHRRPVHPRPITGPKGSQPHGLARTRVTYWSKVLSL